jgi:hypothetical protein
MDVRESEGTAPLVRHEVVLQPSEIPNHQPNPLGRGYFDRRRKERVLHHADDDLALGRRRARENERAAHQKAQSPHRRSS